MGMGVPQLRQRPTITSIPVAACDRGAARNYAMGGLSGRDQQLELVQRRDVDDDYDVRDQTGKEVGRIMRRPQTPEGQAWSWEVTTSEILSSRRGYAQAASKQWRILRRDCSGRVLITSLNC
jgi:hypothetical protein